MDPQGLLLPSGTRLVHIGPHKTGTTAIQSAFVAAADRLPACAVQYFGEDPGRQHLRGALAVTRRKALLGETQPPTHHWSELVAEVATAADNRVLISSEFFADADDETAAKVVRELGGPHAHVLVTLRPLARIIASQWQQYVQNGLRMAYEDWLDRKLNNDPYAEPNPTFWHRHRHDELVCRWATAAGADNLTVAVADEDDRTMLSHTFESLLGLPAGFLAIDKDNISRNRALTPAEIELVRLVNREFRARHWPEEIYASYIREGAVTAMKARSPGPDEDGIETPDWAMKRVAEIGAEMADAIAALGVRVVGDLSSLGWAPEQLSAAAPPAASIQLDAAVRAVVGLVEAREPVESMPVSHRRVRDITARELVGVLAQRVRRRLRRTGTAASE